MNFQDKNQTAVPEAADALLQCSPDWVKILDPAGKVRHIAARPTLAAQLPGHAASGAHTVGSGPLGAYNNQHSSDPPNCFGHLLPNDVGYPGVPNHSRGARLHFPVLSLTHSEAGWGFLYNIK
jgi:hypothetical protein